MAPKSGFYGKGSVDVGPKVEGEGKARRLAIRSEQLVMQPFEGIETIHDVIAYAARTHGDRNALGWRDVIDIHEEAKEVTKIVNGAQVKETKSWKYFQLGEYKYLTFLQVQATASEIARGLLQLGVTTDDIFNIYAQTSANWQLVSFACGFISTTVATAYDTLGEEGLTHSLNEPNCVGIFTNADLLQTVSNVVHNTPSVKYVVYDGQAKSSVIDRLKGARDDLQVLTLDELREKGKDISDDALKARVPKPDTIACIMYTSGSTGPPKGVVLSNANLVASVGAIYVLLGHHLRKDDCFLAYLPLAHILEFIVELCLLFVGCTIGYGRVKTLTDASVRHCKGDLAEFRPTIMVGVPAVWETIRKGIIAKLHAGGAVKQQLFHGAIAVKKANVPVLSQLADTVVLSKVKAATGGRLRLALSGGAALSRETQQFLTHALVIILQGYGMTESCGMCAVLPPELMQYGSVGLPVPSIEVKLLDHPEAGYLSTNNPPQGEVCIRGPSVTQGYYKRPDLNEDENIFTKDGWLRTGDIGQWNPDGTLSLIDRIKNLIKLSGGEYIALERLESVYKASNVVANICVHATPDANQPIAIIFPHEVNLRHAVDASQINKDSSLAELCHNEHVNIMVLKDLNAIGKKNGFRSNELLQAVILTPDEWTTQTGLLTAAQKIQRGLIAKTFAKEIEAAYSTQSK